jgi:hypothetical protein
MLSINTEARDRSQLRQDLFVERTMAQLPEMFE